MTKRSKNFTKCPIWGPFGPNTSKSEISASTKRSFLRFKNNATSLKKSEEN